ncbi:uncharacterized protein [Littorina saxatilis]|uniref:uncharacterized protein n=1 Tax=Littorina saxatilis TaxID=31220 RepID=UPI0038B4279C
MKTRHIASAALQIPFRHFDSTEREQQASKMRWGTFVVVLLVASFVSQSVSGWGRRRSRRSSGSRRSRGSIFRKVATVVGQGVSAVSDLAMDNCELLPTGCDDKRDVGNQDNAMDGGCDAIGDNPVLFMGLSFDVIKDTFEAVDGGDDVLDQAEYIEFLADLQVLNHCIKKAAKDADNES